MPKLFSLYDYNYRDWLATLYKHTVCITSSNNICANILRNYYYAVQCFEGMKAYRGPDGKVRLFRPMENMNRMKRSAVAASLPVSLPHAILHYLHDSFTKPSPAIT